MKMRKEKILLDVLLGAGLYLLDSVRDRVSDNVEGWSDRAHDRYSDLRGRAKDAYSTASERLSRANDALRHDDHSLMRTTGAVLLGVGVGVGIGMLVAPASGKETRDNLAEQMRDRFSEKKKATGTFGG